MFRSSLNRVLDWADAALAWEDEFDGGEEPTAEALSPPVHPHSRELRWNRQRRPGAVPRPPAHCISPIGRRGGGGRVRDGSAR